MGLFQNFQDVAGKIAETDHRGLVFHVMGANKGFSSENNEIRFPLQSHAGIQLWDTGRARLEPSFRLPGCSWSGYTDGGGD